MIEKLSKIEEGSPEYKELEPYLQDPDPVKKQKKSSSKEPYRRFSSPIPDSFVDSIQFTEKDTSINIQCLRMGKFKHPWYGVLRFDQTFFNNVIKNFEADIPNPELAFDFKHQPDYGAAAWINKFFIEDNNLMANVSLTARGKESLKNKEFRYFSIEYTDDYVEYEFTEDTNEEGKTVEKETKISHGPTALGGGLTNRPFIKGMLPVSLHEAGNIIELEEIKDEQLSKEVKESMEKTLEELREEQENIQEKIKELESKEGTSKEELEALITKLEEISAEVKKLSEKGDASDNEETKKTLEELDTTKKKLQEASDALKKKDKEVTKLSEDIKALTDTVKSLMASNKIYQEDKYRLFVEKKLEEFKRLGVFPSTLKIIQEVALSEETKSFAVKLSEGEGDSKAEVNKGFMDIMESILSSIPEANRFTETELSESPRTPTGSSKEVSLEDVEKYAKENNITFEEALVEFSKQGKIE